MTKKKETEKPYNPYRSIEYLTKMLNEVTINKEKSIEATRALYVEVFGMLYLPLYFTVNYTSNSYYAGTTKALCVLTGAELTFEVSYAFLESYFNTITSMYSTSLLK
jgi:hypothetical protein